MRRVCLVLSSWMVAGCFHDFSVVEETATTQPSSSTSSTGGGGAGGDAPDGGMGGTGPVVCAGDRPGPTLLAIPPEQPLFCIDATEVTVGQYRAWLDQDPSLSGQPPRCEFNGSYHPAGFPGPSKDDFPVAGVDWCDAHAYCKGAGKRLCGKVVGGPILVSTTGLPALETLTGGEWYYACSAGFAKKFPYGSEFEKDRCNDDGMDGAATEAASLEGCEGGYPGLFDMSGNLWEFQDACNDKSGEGLPGEADDCYSLGGSWIDPTSLLACDGNGTVHGNGRAAPWANVGFRCCADF